MQIARKRFGQNFLIDTLRLENLITKINPKASDFIIEIGAGTGALTRLLLPTNAQVTALELDRDLISGLKVEFFKYKNFTLLEADALKFDFSQILNKLTTGQKARLIGNLPYNIATNLLFNFWHLSDIADMHFMLQTEVALRLTAKINDKNYGRLSILAQYFGTAEIIMDFPPECFSPPPKVNSSFIKIIPKDKQEIDLQQADNLAKSLRICFAQRRKTLANNLKNYLTPQNLADLNIDASLRPQNLSLQEYLLISRELANNDFNK